MTSSPSFEHAAPSCPNEMLGWLDACYVLTTDDRAFPPLLGTGGKQGSASYVSNFAQAVIDCVLTRQWAAALGGSAFQCRSSRARMQARRQDSSRRPHPAESMLLPAIRAAQPG